MFLVIVYITHNQKSNGKDLNAIWGKKGQKRLRIQFSSKKGI